jgi:hypothetical protein
MKLQTYNNRKWDKIPSYIAWLYAKTNPTPFEKEFRIFAFLRWSRRQLESLLVQPKPMTKNRDYCDCDKETREMEGTPEDGFVCVSCMRPVEEKDESIPFYEDEESIIQ